MRGKLTSALSALFIAGMAPLIVSATTQTGTAQATWKPQEIRYAYSGFTTAYSCDAAEFKLEQILKTLGAHPNTKVRATGCSLTRPSTDFFVTVITATPVAVDPGQSVVAGHVDGKILKQLGLDQSALTQSFPAQWSTVDLSRDRKLDLQPGDCELLEGLREHVLPKLALEVVEDGVSCTPRQLSIQTPTLKVAALLPSKTADKG
jgi:hypothetical protein